MFTRRARLFVIVMVMIVVSSCSIVARVAFRVVMEIAEQVVVQVGAKYVHELLSPDEVPNKPVLQVNHADANGAETTSAYQIDKVDDISVHVVAGDVSISSGGHTTTVTVKRGTAKIEITRQSSRPAGTLSVPDPRDTPQITDSPTPTLVGRWHGKGGNIYEFTASGRNSYSGEVVVRGSGVCTPVNITVSGTGLHFKGTTAFYKNYCHTYDGKYTVILDLASDGAHVRKSFPPEVISSTGCTNCDPETWDRVGT
jgi:hypothetical protein